MQSEGASLPQPTTSVSPAFVVLTYFAPLCLYAFVVLLAPLDVLDRAPLLTVFANATQRWLSSISPAIDIYQHARSTSFPQIAKLASALAVFTTAYIAIAILVRTHLRFREVRPLIRNVVRTTKSRLGGLIVLPLASLSCFWVAFCIGGDWSIAGGLTTKSRLGYLLIALPSIGFVGVALGSWPLQVRLLLLDFFSRRNS